MNPRIRDWNGRKVWILGASRGIGAELAAQLHRRGAQVALSGRDAAALQALAAQLPGAIALPLDITDRGAVDASAAQLLARWGQLDLVVLMAGDYVPMRADAIDPGQVDAILNVNLRAAYSVLHAVLPQLLSQGGGGVALVASVAGYGGLPKALVYGPSKAALINLSESLYLDLRPRGIAVYQVNPGFVDTRLTRGNDFRMPALIAPAEAAQEIVAGLEAGRFHIHFPRRFSNTLRLMRLLPYRVYFWLVQRGTGL